MRKNKHVNKRLALQPETVRVLEGIVGGLRPRNQCGSLNVGSCCKESAKSVCGDCGTCP